MQKALAVALFSLALATPALASAPVVSRAEQQQIKSLLAQFGTDDLAYVPASAPKRFVLVNTQADATQSEQPFFNVADAEPTPALGGVHRRQGIREL